MRTLLSKGAFAIFLFLLALPAAQCKAKHQLNHDVVDAFKAIGAVVYSIALFDIDQDGDLDCVTALRTEFDKSVPSATYVWILPGLSGKEKKNVTIHVRAGTSPDKPVLTVGDDGPEQTAKFFYTDYKTCAVFEAPFQGLEECMVWVAKDVIADPPQDCVDEYEDNCDVKHIACDENTCSPFIA
ncbi:hypothetical protein V5799_032188 [Amblyomma americanum]|uniref:Lipocalin-5 1 n=1 Tax=Amblyomma americanum TaxID=6943 RepID=A0AAQ4DRW1_AMBAM